MMDFVGLFVFQGLPFLSGKAAGSVRSPISKVQSTEAVAPDIVNERQWDWEVK